MQTLDWRKALLLDNPFITTPPMPWEDIVWADMSELKARFERRVRSALQTSPSALVLNYGPWGGGKTHAARYFSQDTVLKTLSDSAKVMIPPLSIIVDIPRGAKSVIRAIYLHILDAIGIRQISQSITQVAHDLGEKFEQVTRALVRSEEFVSALLILAGQQPETMQQQLITLTGGQILPELKRYFLASATASDLKTLKLSRNIESGSDMMQILSTIFNLLLYSTKDVAPKYSEIFLWFDEMEEIVSLPGREQHALTSLIRDLTDFIPGNLTTFINFTPRPGGEIEEVSSYLGPAVWSRIRERIIFRELGEENLREYISDLLNVPKFRPDELQSQCPDRLFPFSDEAIRFLGREVIDQAHAVPRYINEACSLIVEQAVVGGILDEPDARINLDFVRTKSEQLKELLEYK